MDAAPGTRNVITLKQVLANTFIPLLKYPPYSLYLALCDLCLFSKVKTTLEGSHFQSVEGTEPEIEIC